MQSRPTIKACAAAAFAVSLGFAQAGFAQELAALAPDAEPPGAFHAAPAAMVQAAPQLPPATAGLPDPRPEWPGGPAASAAPASPAAAAPQLGPRSRDAWLRECRGRTDFYYDAGYDYGYRRKGTSSRARHRDHGYDYCEAYLDDYYRYYAQAGHGFAHPGHGYMTMAPRMTMVPAHKAQPAASQQPCEEVVTEEYVPEATRTIRRRPPLRRVPDKRIRIN